MYKIRNEKLEWANREKIDTYLSESKTGYLGLSDGSNPYVVPLNFVWHQGMIYFHGASEGRKMEMIRANNTACFTVSENLGTITNPIPAKTDTAYMSVMLFGGIEMIEDLDEATEAMQAMLNKYVPGYYEQPLAKSHIEKYRSSLGSKTAILKLKPEQITAKENPIDKNKLFFTGKTVQVDLK